MAPSGVITHTAKMSLPSTVEATQFVLFLLLFGYTTIPMLDRCAAVATDLLRGQPKNHRRAGHQIAGMAVYT